MSPGRAGTSTRDVGMRRVVGRDRDDGRAEAVQRGDRATVGRGQVVTPPAQRANPSVSRRKALIMPP